MKPTFLLITLMLTGFTAGAENVHYTFPDDTSVLNAKRDFGAKADGKADDTEALQQAIKASCGDHAKFGSKTKALFLPNGIYRVTKSLVAHKALGPWICGDRPLHVPAPVRMILGLGWARLLGGKDGGFVVDDQSAPLVKFQNIDSFGGPFI
jgi:hypothetical protein